MRWCKSHGRRRQRQSGRRKTEAQFLRLLASGSLNRVSSNSRPAPQGWCAALLPSTLTREVSGPAPSSTSVKRTREEVRDAKRVPVGHQVVAIEPMEPPMVCRIPRPSKSLPTAAAIAIGSTGDVNAIQPLNFGIRRARQVGAERDDGQAEELLTRAVVRVAVSDACGRQFKRGLRESSDERGLLGRVCPQAARRSISGDVSSASRSLGTADSNA